MAVKKNLPTMVDISGSETNGKTDSSKKNNNSSNKNTGSGNTSTQTSGTGTQSSTPSSTPTTTPDKMPSVPNTTQTASPTTTPVVSGSGNVTSTPVTSLTDEEEEYYDNLYHKGGWTQDQQEAISHGGSAEVGKTNSQGDWYFYDSADRTEYADDADATFMNGSDYYLTTQNKNEWHRLNEEKKIAKQNGDTALVAQIQAQQDALHAANEQIRAKYGYTGGEDGSMYEQIDTGDQNHDYDGYTGNYGGVSSGGGGYVGGMTGGSISGSSGSISSGGIRSELKGYLDAWQKAALEQSNGKVDYAVQQAVAELQRALEDAQPMFKEQAETVARDERQAMDNSALYAELRGDKGGIGQEQYNSIQNAAAQNRLAVQQAQTKLATDTERQIADLRAQGEFEKADAALEITQTYLAQLMSLEQWAAEYNLSVEQFQASLQQWEAEYQLAIKQLEIGQSQWQQEFSFQQQQYAQQFAFQQQQYQDSLALNQKNQMADIAWSLLQAGVELDADQLKALDISADQATSMILQAQMKQNSSSSNKGSSDSITDVYQWLADNGAVDQGTAYNLLVMSGKFNSTEANNFAKYFESWAGYEDATVGLSPSFDYVMAQAQTMSRENAEKYLKSMVTRGRKNGGITDAEMRYILGTANFYTDNGGATSSGKPQYTPVQGI